MKAWYTESCWQLAARCVQSMLLRSSKRKLHKMSYRQPPSPHINWVHNAVQLSKARARWTAKSKSGRAGNKRAQELHIDDGATPGHALQRMSSLLLPCLDPACSYTYQPPIDASFRTLGWVWTCRDSRLHRTLQEHVSPLDQGLTGAPKVRH